MLVDTVAANCWGLPDLLSPSDVAWTERQLREELLTLSASSSPTGSSPSTTTTLSPATDSRSSETASDDHDDGAYVLPSAVRRRGPKMGASQMGTRLCDAVTRADLLRYREKWPSQLDAAGRLGISLTSLKRLCKTRRVLWKSSWRDPPPDDEPLPVGRPPRRFLGLTREYAVKRDPALERWIRRTVAPGHPKEHVHVLKECRHCGLVELKAGRPLCRRCGMCIECGAKGGVRHRLCPCRRACFDERSGRNCCRRCASQQGSDCSGDC